MANSISRLNSLPDDVLADLEIAKEVALGYTSDDLSFMFKGAAIIEENTSVLEQTLDSMVPLFKDSNVIAVDDSSDESTDEDCAKSKGATLCVVIYPWAGGFCNAM